MTSWVSVKTIYKENFKNKEDIERDFGYKLTSENIIFATYEEDFCDGEALVIFEHGGKLFEVNAAHCSCYGLEDQWIPEETTLEALKITLKNGAFKKYYDEIIDMLVSATNINELTKKEQLHRYC